MLELGLWFQGLIFQQFVLNEIGIFWTGVALKMLPKVDPDNAGECSAQDIKQKQRLEEIG